MVSIKLILDKRRIKSDNTYSLRFQIYFNRKTRTRFTGLSLSPDEWDEINQIITKKHFNYKVLNAKLKKQLAELQAELLLTDELKVQSYLEPSRTASMSKQKSVFEFAQELIQHLKLENKVGNAWVYQSTINALKEYHPEEDLFFEQIDYTFLESYQRHLRLKGIKPNSVYLYLRTLRIFYNKAIKLKLAEKALYPFDEFKLKAERTPKRAVDKELLLSIRSLCLPEESTIWHVRNWFLLSFYLIGISIIDLALLEPANYQNGRIRYKRRKTGKWYDVKVFPEAEQLLKLYLSDTQRFILPIINYECTTEEKLMRVVKSRTKLINKYLNRLALLVGHEGSLTTYTVRHTFATTAKKLGYSNELIAEALGHEYGNRITNIYLDSFDKEVVDEMHGRVIG